MKMLELIEATCVGFFSCMNMCVDSSPGDPPAWWKRAVAKWTFWPAEVIPPTIGSTAKILKNLEQAANTWSHFPWIPNKWAPFSMLSCLCWTLIESTSAHFAPLNLSCLLRYEWRHQMWKVWMSSPALPFTGYTGLPVNVPYRTGSLMSAGSIELKVSQKVFCEDHGLRGAQGSGALCWPNFPLHVGAFLSTWVKLQPFCCICNSRWTIFDRMLYYSCYSNCPFVANPEEKVNHENQNQNEPEIREWRKSCSSRMVSISWLRWIYTWVKRLNCIFLSTVNEIIGRDMSQSPRGTS